MTKYLVSLLALMGIHQHLSAEQRQDIAGAIMQATPGAAATGVFKVWGLPLSDVEASFAALLDPPGRDTNRNVGRRSLRDDDRTGDSEGLQSRRQVGRLAHHRLLLCCVPKA